MASASLGRLTLDLVAQIGQFVGPITQAERKAKESTAKMGKAFSDFKEQMNASLGGTQIGSAIEGITGKLGALRGGYFNCYGFFGWYGGWWCCGCNWGVKSNGP